MIVYELLKKRELNKVGDYLGMYPAETFLKKVRVYKNEIELDYWNTGVFHAEVKDFITYDNNSITIFI